MKGIELLFADGGVDESSSEDTHDEGEGALKAFLVRSLRHHVSQALQPGVRLSDDALDIPLFYGDGALGSCD